MPKRGIGVTSINKVTDYALEKGIDFYTALRYVDEVPGMARSAGICDVYTVASGESRDGFGFAAHTGNNR